MDEELLQTQHLGTVVGVHLPTVDSPGGVPCHRVDVRPDDRRLPSFAQLAWQGAEQPALRNRCVIEFQDFAPEHPVAKPKTQAKEGCAVMLEYSHVTINGVEIPVNPQPTMRKAAELRHPSIVIEDEAARRIRQILFQQPLPSTKRVVADWMQSFRARFGRDGL